MVCPFGTECVTSVIDSRKNSEGIRRRRECSTCGLRFTTYEKADINLMVQKNSGDIEEFSYEKLPEISEFTNHKLLVGETLKSAEDLHGRLIASLRNNETDVSPALLIAINMNKEIEQNSFNDALEIFKINKTNLYNSLDTLP